jgi:hypothetical protein
VSSGAQFWYSTNPRGSYVTPNLQTSMDDEDSPLCQRDEKQVQTAVDSPVGDLQGSCWTVVYSVLTVCLASVLVGTTLAYSSPAVLELKQIEDPDLKFNTHLSGIFGVSSVGCL